MDPLSQNFLQLFWWKKKQKTVHNQLTYSSGAGRDSIPSHLSSTHPPPPIHRPPHPSWTPTSLPSPTNTHRTIQPPSPPWQQTWPPYYSINHSKIKCLHGGWRTLGRKRSWMLWRHFRVGFGWWVGWMVWRCGFVVMGMWCVYGSFMSTLGRRFVDTSFG
jgi:hypothetical protein